MYTERGEHLTPRHHLVMDVIKSIKAAKEEYLSRKYGTRERRKEAYCQLHAACEVLFTVHADDVGYWPKPNPDESPCQRLVFEGPVGVDEFIIDKNMDGEGVYTVTAKSGRNGDSICEVVPGTGWSPTICNDVYYRRDKDTNDDSSVIMSGTKQTQPLSADRAYWLAAHLAHDLAPVLNHKLMEGARYTTYN